MALNSSGPISLAGSTAGQSIAVELSQSATGQISLNDANVRTLAGVPSGAITMPTNFWGKSNTVGSYNIGNTSLSLVHYGISNVTDSSGNLWTYQGSGTSPRPVYVAKYNSTNVLQSLNAINVLGASPYFSGAYISPATSQAVGLDSSNNMYVIGNLSGSGSGGFSGTINMIGDVLLKFTSAGAYSTGTILSRYATTFNGFPAVNSYMYSYNVTADTSGNTYHFAYHYYVWQNGYSGPCCCFPNYFADVDIYFIKTTSSLALTSSYLVGRCSGQTGSYSTGTHATNSSGDSIAAYNAPFPGYRTALIKMTSSNTVAWSYSYAITISGSVQVFAVSQGKNLFDSSGNYYAFSFTNSKFLKVNSSGTYQHCLQYNMSTFSTWDTRDAITDSSDNVYVLGRVYDGLNYSMFINKFNSSGTLQWVRIVRWLGSPYYAGTRNFEQALALSISGSTLRISFTATNPGDANSALWGSLYYPTSGSFTGNTNVFFPGSGTNYLTFSISSDTATIYTGVLSSATAGGVTVSSNNPGASSVSYTSTSAITITTSKQDF